MAQSQGSGHVQCPIFMTMEVSPQHHATVLGKGNINLKIIMQKTNTTIIFPDAGDPNIPPIKKGSVTISSNSIHNVYLARSGHSGIPFNLSRINI